MSINISNQELIEKFFQNHLSDGGKNPHSYAYTELIRDSIINRNYKIYNGGGYDAIGNNILRYDVLVSFSMGGDPTFSVCIDNSEGDMCQILFSDGKGEMLTQFF